MSARWFFGLALLATSSACIAPSVLAPADRGGQLTTDGLVWSDAMIDDLPGTYVSTELSGPLAAVLRKLVYLFEAGGSYTGAALIDDAPPHFEVIAGRWQLSTEGLQLDEGAVARVEVADDGSLRLTGEEGVVVLRRELAR